MTTPLKNLKVLPHSKESEMMVLGCMLTSINSLNTTAEALEESDFYYSEHQIIFTSLKQAFLQDKPADIHLTSESLKRVGKLDAIGGSSYLMELAQYAGTSAYIEEYVGVVKDLSLLRAMINAAQLIEKKAYDEPKQVEETLEEAQQLFFKISQSRNAQAGSTLQEILSGAKAEAQVPYLKALQQRQEDFLNRDPENDLGITGVPTHFNDLDKMLNGLGKSNLIILAARPAMGKTALAVNIAENICFKSQVPVGIFSLEMSAEQLLQRIVCSQSEVESSKIQTGSINGVEFQRVVEAVNRIESGTMVIDDQPGLKISDLKARARRMKEAHNIGALIIDYLQLLSGSSSFRNMESRQNEISEISRGLKNLARELNIPVICLSQLSRRVEERTGHRPMMSDLRESGSIEQDADVVTFLLRRDYYDPLDKPGMAELIIAKNRHGGVGSVNFTFRKEIGQFANYTAMNESIMVDILPL